MAKLKPHERSEIIGMHKARVPLKQISRNTGKYLSTVKYTVKKAAVRDEAQHDLPRSGRPRKSTRNQDNHLYRHARIRNDISWAELVELAPIKRTQIQQRFREIDPNFRQYLRQWSPYLSPQNIVQWFQYAKNYSSFSSEWWANVWCTDECSIEIGTGRARKWVWRHSGEAWAPQMRAIGSKNHETFMIWAAMRADGRTVYRTVRDFYAGGRTQTAEVYCRILRDVLPEIYEPGQAWLQDNASVHTAYVVRDLIEEYGVWMLPHPGKSPDLNPIEHFWWKLKELVHELHPELETMGLSKDARIDALEQAVHHAMTVINGFEQWDLPAKLIASMPKRLAAVRLVQGKQTKY